MNVALLTPCCHTHVGHVDAYSFSLAFTWFCIFITVQLCWIKRAKPDFQGTHQSTFSLLCISERKRDPKDHSDRAPEILFGDEESLKLTTTPAALHQIWVLWQQMDQFNDSPQWKTQKCWIKFLAAWETFSCVQESSISKPNKRNRWHLNDLHTCDIKVSVRRLVVKFKVRLVKVGRCVFYTNEWKSL